MIDREGVASFLAIMFGVTFALEGALIASGLLGPDSPPIILQLAIAVVTWVPTLATVLTIKWVARSRSR